MAHRSQCSSAGDNPLDPNYLPPHYREEYRMAIDALVDADLEGYYGFLQEADVVDFLSHTEIEYIKCMVQAPRQSAQPEGRYMAEDADGSSDTYWPVHSDHDAPSLDLGWPQHFRFVGPTEVTTLVNPSDPETPSIKEQVRRMIKNAQQVIAVVMDMFTDVDIFADILNAATRGVAVYILLDEMNAHHFVAMVNNCRVNLDEIQFMRVRTVTGTTYYCRKGKTFKGQMMDRFILVDCRAVLSGNYSFMWSCEKIHRCLAHLFLGQLVITFDEEFRILFAHSEPLVVKNILANMPQYSSEPENYYNTKKTHMFNRQYPPMGMEWADRTAEDHMNIGHKMLPFRSDSVHSATEVNPPVQRHMNMHVPPQYRGDHQFIEHGRQMRGPAEMAGLKRNSYGNIPDYEYLPPANHPTMRGNQYMEGPMPQSGQFAREPHIFQGPGLQSGYDIYGRFRGQGHHIDQFSGSGYPHEGGETESSGGYDHVQRYLQSHSPMEEGHGPRNPPMQLNLKRHSVGHSYACQTSPTQSNLPEQKRFFGINRKPQDVSQKQGLRDWRISSYLSAFDDAGELDLAELEGSSACNEVPEVPCGPVHAENRPENIEFNRENPTFVQIQNESIVPESSVNHPTNLSQLNIKTTPTSTLESSCTTEGDKAEEMQIKKPKEINRIGEDFLKRKPSRPVQRGSRLRHSLIFSTNLELQSSDEMKDTAGEKDVDEASKLSDRVSQILDKRRTGSPFQPFQWRNSATFDNSATESAQPEDEQNKMGENTDLDKVETSPNLRRNSLKDTLQEKDLPQTTVPEGKSQKHECLSDVLQRSSSFIDMTDPDCRLRFFKDLAAKRKLAAAKSSQSNPVKATQKFALPEKTLTKDADKKTAPVLKTPETLLKSKNTTVPENKETRCEESSKDILQRATDAEKIRLKKKLAEESGKSVEEARTFSIAKNQTSPVLKVFTQKPLSDDILKPHTSSSSEPFSRNSGPLSAVHATFESNSSQNQVDSVVFNTSSAESGTTQYHVPKKTSNAVLKDSGSSVAESSVVKNPSQQHTSAEVDLPKINSTRESQPCQKSISTDIDLTQTAPLMDDFSQHPSISTETSQNVINAKEADSLQQPPAAELSTNFTQVISASSQHPTKTKEDLSQSDAKSRTEISHHSTPAEMTTASVIQSPHFHNAKENLKPSSTDTQMFIQTDTSTDFTSKTTDSSQQPTATTTVSSQHSTTTLADSSQRLVALEPSQKPISVEKDNSLQSATLVVNSILQQPVTKESDSSQQPNAKKTHSSQEPAKIEARFASEPTKIETGTSQQCIPTMADFFQRPTATETESSLQSNATKVESSQKLTATKPEFFVKSTETEADLSQKPTTAETVSSLQSKATEIGSSQKPIASGSLSSLQSTSIEIDSSQKPTATEADSSQKPTATESLSSLQSTSIEKDSSQKPTALETDSSQKLTATETDSSTKPTASGSLFSLPSTSKEKDSFQKPTASENDSFQKPSELESLSSLQSTSIEKDSSQKPTASQTDSSQKPTASETDSSQKPTESQTDSSQSPTESQTDSSQKPTESQTDSSQKPTESQTDSSQKPTESQTDSSQKPTESQTDSSQKPTASETDSSQKPTESQTDSSQSPTESQTDSSQKPIESQTDSSQKPTASETDSSQKPTESQTDSSQKPTESQTDSSQKPTESQTDSSQKPTESQTDSSQKPTTSETDSSQKPTTSETDSSQKPTASETDFSKHPAPNKADPSQQSAPTDIDSWQQSNATEADPSQQPTLLEAGVSQSATLPGLNPSEQPTPLEKDSFQQPVIVETHSTETGLDTSKHPIEAEKESLQHITATKSDCVNEEKDGNLSEDFSKVIPTPHVNISQTDNSISQNTVITGLFSPIEQSQHHTIPSCYSQVKLDDTEPPVVKDKENSALTSLKSVEVSSTQPEVTQVITQLESSILSTPSCLNDPKPQKADGYQQNGTIAEQLQRREGPEIANRQVKTALDSNKVDIIKQTTSEEENSVSKSAEVSEKSNLTEKSSVAENPKSTLSPHQLSTANVISCSNLRDDTKVLLEQISAKNQSRSTQSKSNNAAPNEGEVSSPDKLFSNYSGRPWTSKTSQEEREMLLQKMDKLRKERKVYSRFEAS